MLLFADGLVVAENQTVKVGDEEGCRVGVVNMKAEQFLVQPDRLDVGESLSVAGTSHFTNSSADAKTGLSADSSKASSGLAAACSPEA